MTQRSRLTGICLFAVLPLFAPVAAYAQSTVYACVNSSSGTIKIVTADTTCKTNEVKLSWDVAGVQGPQGPAGPQGPQGPAGAQGPAGPTNVFGLSVSKTGTGTGLVTSSDTGIVCDPDCTEVYPAGTSVTLTATPANGSTFIGWSGDCSNTGSCTLTLSATRTVAAQFDLVTTPPPGPSTLSSSPNPASLGSSPVGGSGTSRTLTVTNTGTLPTGLISSSILGSDASEFSIGNDTCTGSSLAPGSSCTIDLFLDPIASGARHATLHLTAEPGGILDLGLVGFGLPGPPL